MELHELITSLILSTTSSLALAALSFFLMGLYLLQLFFLDDQGIIFSREIRGERLILRAINWGIFGAVFFLFGDIIHIHDVTVWRATARVALFFLMLPEIAYQTMILWPSIKYKLRKKWNKA